MSIVVNQAKCRWHRNININGKDLGHDDSRQMRTNFLRTSKWRRIGTVQWTGLIAIVCILPQFWLLSRQNASTESIAGGILPRPSRPLRLLPTPILLMGMPKTGTSTVHTFFERSGYRSSHYRCIERLYCGLCIRAALQKGQPALKSCGDYEVWAQMDVENLGQCHFPQIVNLEELHNEAPNATFVLTHRNMTKWAKSVKNWVGATRSMAARLAKCEGGPKSKTAEDLISWYWQHVERIRSFVREHPTHALVEIDIESPRAGAFMEEHFGASTAAENWGHENTSTNNKANRIARREEQAKQGISP